MSPRAAKAGKNRKRSIWDFFRSSAATRMLICLLGTAVIMVLFEAAIVPTRYSLEVGMVPTSTIAATKDVVDELSTQQKREEAAAQVTPTYRFQEGVTETVMNHFDQIFAQLRAVRQYASMLPDASSTRVYSRDELQYAHSLLTLISLSDYQLTSLMRSTQEELEDAYTLLYAALQSTMQGHVTEGQESNAVYNIRQIVNYRVSIPLGQNVVPAVLSACVQANMIIDQEVTEAAREAAREAVEPVVYKQGQNIVVRGEGRVTANQLAMLSTLGLLSNGEADMSIYSGAAVLVVLVMTGMLLLLRHFPHVHVMDDNGRLLLMLTIMAMSLSMSVLGRLANAYLAPMMMCALLVTALLGLAPGVVCNASLTILVAALAAGGSEEYAEKMALLLVSGLLSGTTAAMVMHHKGTRLWVLVSGLAGGVVDFAAIMALGLMTNSELSGSLAIAAWRAGGAVLGTLLCIAVQPLLEMIFNLPTPMKLMELSNPNQPLLRRLLLEAPGTYHHSTIVSSLAEAAAQAIGANSLLARVGGYYHDIGKLKRPSYFTENQMGGVNAHEHTDPYVSAAIITAHTRDGVALAKAYRLPEAVQNIIAEHHGNTPVMYFYHKALQMANGNPVDIENFRYDGYPPRTKEGAIVMLCDTIEAAVRTMKNPTMDGIEEFIVRLVRGKLEDGQLNDCPLTLRDIDRICAAATQVLAGVFHERIEYPNMDDIKLRAARPDLAVEEANIEAENAVAFVELDEGESPAVELSSPKPLQRVEPEMGPELMQVQPPTVTKPVPINELVTIEPLPTKEMEQELMAKMEGQIPLNEDERHGGRVDQPEDMS
ncbi:MAG: HDIG domain-containing protein [Clostridia bacterium]|nr:HDIG domain-containing protein [Clostridia bacterium]